MNISTKNDDSLRIGRVRLRAYAKLNLTLEVLFKRNDGYHELRTVMHSIDVFDTLTVTKNDSDTINVRCSVPLPKNNTAYSAAQLFMEYTGCGGVNIEIEKGIPSEAGMGGASADAAGVLRAMESIYGKINEQELYAIGRRVGADVPFCLHGGCALAEGIGERLTGLNPIKLNLLVIKGERGVSTGCLFRSLKLSAAGKKTDAAIEAITAGNVEELSESLGNALMPAAEASVPEIADYRRRLLKCGALGACMTGSGSAVYGIFSSEAAASNAAKQFSDCEFCAVCKTRETPIEIVFCM
ncbi:MAG: 4-(cytidine 5'-diphospho)-2-C-methyl-D-erythritol kinase [Christensenellaceae bacterium]|nr:4-(cytidine 5'-diphospho)-2-C-methyl-D-erythritol kinase [Christensenellaceae bacterium]